MCGALSGSWRLSCYLCNCLFFNCINNNIALLELVVVLVMTYGFCCASTVLDAIFLHPIMKILLDLEAPTYNDILDFPTDGITPPDRHHKKHCNELLP